MRPLWFYATIDNHNRELTVNEETKASFSSEANVNRLYRSVSNRRVAGICGGLAEYFNVDPFLTRAIWVISIFATHFATLLAYFVAWAIIPENPRAMPLPTTKTSSSNNGQYVFGLLLILLGFFFLADRMDWDFLIPWHWRLPYWFSWGAVFSVLLILLGAALVFRPEVLPSFSATTGPATAGTTSDSGETASASPRPEMRANEKRLIRSLHERMIGGVCGGLAKYLNLDPSLVRLGFVILTLLSGFVIGIVTYIVMMIVLPEETQNPMTSSPLTPVNPA